LFTYACRVAKAAKTRTGAELNNKKENLDTENN